MLVSTLFGRDRDRERKRARERMRVHLCAVMCIEKDWLQLDDAAMDLTLMGVKRNIYFIDDIECVILLFLYKHMYYIHIYFVCSVTPHV